MLEASSSGRREVRYNVHPMVPRSQHSLYKANETGEDSDSDSSRLVGPTLIEPRRPPTPPPRLRSVAHGPRPLLSSCASAIVYSLAAEVEAREAITDEETAAALGQFPFPLLPDGACGDRDTASSGVHPALAHAVGRLCNGEAFHRRTLAAEEREARAARLDRVGGQLRSVASPGSTIATARHLRRWVAHFRGRRLLHRLQREALAAREHRSRLELYRWDDDSAARYAALTVSLVAQERMYRAVMGLTWAKVAYATGLASIRLAQQCASFPLLFGCPMGRAQVCGRVTGATVFRNLCICEEVGRAAVGAAEAGGRVQLPLSMGLLDAVEREEPAGRAAITAVESAARADQRPGLLHVLCYYDRRDVERYEAVERSFGLEAAHESILRVAEREREEEGEGEAAT